MLMVWLGTECFCLCCRENGREGYCKNDDDGEVEEREGMRQGTTDSTLWHQFQIACLMRRAWTCCVVGGNESDHGPSKFCDCKPPWIARHPRRSKEEVDLRRCSRVRHTTSPKEDHSAKFTPRLENAHTTQQERTRLVFVHKLALQVTSGPVLSPFKTRPISQPRLALKPENKWLKPSRDLRQGRAYRVAL